MSTNSNSIGMPSILLVVFVVLKLCKVIDWSWWWVLSPFWIMAAIVILLVILQVLIERAERHKTIKRFNELKKKK